jgi:uncharacterized membrane protein HdeD (DUF308 family)
VVSELHKNGKRIDMGAYMTIAINWWALVIRGQVAIAVTVLMPAITALALVYVIAAWALVTGAFEIAAAIRLRKAIAGEWFLGLSGAASILFGIMLAVFRLAGIVVIAFVGRHLCRRL